MSTKITRLGFAKVLKQVQQVQWISWATQKHGVARQGNECLIEDMKHKGQGAMMTLKGEQKEGQIYSSIQKLGSSQ